MSMMQSPRILIRESNSRLVYFSRSWWMASELDILNYLQVSLLGFG